MSEPRVSPSGGLLLRYLRLRPRLACAVAVVGFLLAVAQFFQPGTGFTSLISIGDVLDSTKVAALRATPHHVYEKSAGYDGAYYVQLALYPTLDNPELTKAIDNLPYRAKRILFCWVAWLAGGGEPWWVIQAHALLNVACWLGLAWVLLRWFPADSWENVLRWAAVLFSHGVCMSVRHSLVDVPSLLLVALAIRWLEDGRRITGGVTLALAGLGKETSLLAAAGLEVNWKAPRTWPRTLLAVGATALPLLAWMAYVRGKFGPAEDPGFGNFTLPFAGWSEKLAASWKDVVQPGAPLLAWATLATVLALGVQWLFLVLHRRPGDRWWRVGAAFAGMMIFLSTPVWEGFPGASTRVLLPMTLAFNILVPRGIRWLPVLLAGNLTVAASFFEYSPPQEFFTLRGEASGLKVAPSRGWHGPEQHFSQHWRWSSGAAELRLVNSGSRPLQVVIQGQVSSAEGVGQLRVQFGERLLWGDTITVRPEELRFGLTVPPGETVLTFTSDLPARRVGNDPRELGFRVANLDIVVRRSAVRP